MRSVIPMGECLCDGDYVCREHQVDHDGDVEERFGIPNPRKIMSEVDRIVDEKLGGKSGPEESSKPDQRDYQEG
jgi:hypothetical protein